MIIDCAVYRDGVRETTPHDSTSLDAALAGLGEDEFLWIGIANPTSKELHRVADSLSLHPLAVEDALEAHQRPKVERYADHTFMSIRTVSYSDDDITTHEVNLFLGANYLLTVRHGGPEMRDARKAAESMIDQLSHGPTAALYAVVDSIVDHYEDVAAELETDVQEVESSVFSAERSNDSTRIYRLKRETLEFRRAVFPLREPIHRFATSSAPETARPYFRDIGDHLDRAAEAIDSIDHLLDNALNAHLAQLSVQQNEDMRKLTAGATLFAVPTAIAGVYGMNFEHMPELNWTYGYPACMVVIAGLCLYIYRRFKRSGWL
ncbi:magnesium/cobalt transporter CorA [Aeromicrobium chenweiae]|uniref:Magnesium transport protein CorA n=1 Tax=Aeromicrobium chenweiae TaxID=2079793 RepID=A0A2S0WM29_9ACTN|nr:magnesium/cobalt transporter CorA [Aeromicrobium chenweiae]AWB92367.1 magnesium and cobalt transport protein CorA [Aeromicrobium chenweiae]TGN31345.1 magnesium/cobalt transporter CorA [Aeromicrobium chenweiae]